MSYITTPVKKKTRTTSVRKANIPEKTTILWGEVIGKYVSVF